MTDAERDELRKRVEANNQKMADGIAHAYVGRYCPVNKDECKGPRCMWFLPLSDATGKVVQGTCAPTQIAAHTGPVADGLAVLANHALSGTARNTGIQGAGGVSLLP